MNRKVIATAIATSLLTLIVANLVAENLRREERQTVPKRFRGIWEGEDAMSEADLTLHITQGGLRLMGNENTTICDAEEVLIYYDGMLLTNNLFGDKKMAVVCDKRSTRLDKRGPDIGVPPEDYRKKYLFSVPQESQSSRVMIVEETEYIPNQYSAGGGAHVMYISHFKN